MSSITDISRCVECQEKFCRDSHTTLPFTCTQWGQYTLCGACLKTTNQCSICESATGLQNLKDGTAAPNQVLCTLLERLTPDLVVGQAVQSLWPCDNEMLYFPGKVVKINQDHSGNFTYDIHFDDGDKRLSVARPDIVSAFEDGNDAKPRSREKGRKSRKRSAESLSVSPPAQVKSTTDESISRKPSARLSKRLINTESDTIDDVASPDPVASLPRPIMGLSSNTTIACGANKQEFMDAPLFHLNSFIRAKVHNKGFGPFIGEQIATCGFDAVGDTVYDLVRQNASRDDIRNAIQDSWDLEFADAQHVVMEAQQVTTWLMDLKVGSFLLMRHEIKRCPFLPNALKDEQGHYFGPVYVLGKVTAILGKNSTEEKEFARRHPHIKESLLNNFVRVHWLKMGRKDNLQLSTKRYIAVICQPTFAKICPPGKVWKKLDTSSEQVRHDLWNNAEFPVNPSDYREITKPTIA